VIQQVGGLAGQVDAVGGSVNPAIIEIQRPRFDRGRLEPPSSAELVGTWEPCELRTRAPSGYPTLPPFSSWTGGAARGFRHELPIRINRLGQGDIGLTTPR
jgi:hypothetical protein